MSSSSQAQPTKKQKMTKVCCFDHTLEILSDYQLLQIIGTHNGTFHCDEALAVFLLRQTATYRDSGKFQFAHTSTKKKSPPPPNIPADLKRSRDPAVLDTCDIVVDVGAIYDESKQRFDHHQRGFTQVFGHGFETKLSSAGLIYKWAFLPPLDRV